MRYKIHRFPIKMTKDQDRLQEFLNNLRGEVVSVIPNISPVPLTWHARINFLLIIEKRN